MGWPTSTHASMITYARQTVLSDKVVSVAKSKSNCKAVESIIASVVYAPKNLTLKMLVMTNRLTAFPESLPFSLHCLLEGSA